MDLVISQLNLKYQEFLDALNKKLFHAKKSTSSSYTRLKTSVWRSKKQMRDIQAKSGPTVATFEQVKNVFLDGNKASARYLVVDDQEKRKMLEKLLSNVSIKNKTVAQYQFKSPYQKLANMPKNANIELLCAC